MENGVRHVCGCSKIDPYLNVCVAPDHDLKGLTINLFELLQDAYKQALSNES